MILSIKENPFRVLGVFANATLKEVTANQSRLKAYAKVGKTLEFPADLTPALPSPERNLQAVEDAASAINLPADKIKHALFCFVNTSSIDDIAIKHIQTGNYDKAFEIFSKKKCFSSLLNSGVLSLSQDDIGRAVENISELIHNDVFRTEFSDAICGSTFKIDADTLAKLFIDELLIYISAADLLAAFKTHGKSANDSNYLLSLAVNEPISLINSEIEKAKNCGDSAYDEYLAALKLINNTTSALDQLKQYLKSSDLRYQTTVDALARQILQCGINYFNASEDDDAINKALYVQGYAKQIAVGQVLKDRCAENVAILEQQKETHMIRKELKALTILIQKIKGEYKSEFEQKYGILSKLQSPFGTSFSEIGKFVKECNQELNSISRKVGRDNIYYINYSDLVAKIALNELIDSVNKVQIQGQLQNSKDDIKCKIFEATVIMLEIKKIQMKTETNTSFNKNSVALQKIYDDLNKTWMDENPGCVVFLIILIISIIAISVSKI